jgi:acetylglutamate kinase
MLVLKISGQELDDPTFVKRIGQAIVAVSEPLVMVHGGGKEIRELQERLGIEPQYVDGLRVTDTASLSIVKMVLAGRINKRLVASLSAAGVDAFGMSGVDRACIKAKKREHPGGDLGQVGEVVEVRVEVFKHLLDEGVTPILSPICYGPDGTMFNVNADEVATAISVALHATMLVFVTNAPGVLRDNQLISNLTMAEVEQLIDEKIITDGMIPKVRSATLAVKGGVAAVRITDMDGLKAGTGTTIVP